MLKASYLKKSKTGWYSYRRKVPNRLRAYFPRTMTGGDMLEWKASFNTKDSATAQRLWVEENRRFAEAERVAETVFQSQRGNVTGSDALRAAKQIAEISGFHPDQAPKLPPNSTDADWEAFQTQRAEWEMWLSHQREILAEQAEQDRIDHKQLKRDYKSGRWAEQGYATPYKNPKPNSVISLATKILHGELTPKLEPSWRDAVELYISVNKQDKTREPLKEQKWEVKTRGLLERFGRSQGGMGARLDQLDRAAIRSWMQATYTNQGTRNRYLNTLSAVINTWNRENAANPVPNPFSGLANKQREQEQATKRLSFNPDQFDKFLAAIFVLRNDEIRLVGLLMAYTGCRTSEAAGLQCKDVKLDANVPHVVFRSNKIRRMDKGGLERAVPVVEPLLSALKSYNRKGGQDDPFFAKYGHTRGFDTVSITLRNALTNTAKIAQDGLVPYSLRHTMKDRLDAAGVRTDLAEYILGHTSQGASRIHQGDACEFDAQRSFGVTQFDRIVLSYSLSMIPDWRAALVEAMRHLAPGGHLHIVDFGTQNRLPPFASQTLNAWLARFHVTPRRDLQAALISLTENSGMTLDVQHLYRSYAQYAVIRSP